MLLTSKMASVEVTLTVIYFIPKTKSSVVS
jgi:hypothetical protein